MAHDWSQYERSPGRTRSGWMIYQRVGENRAVEFFACLNDRAPAVVQLVQYGPRGGVHVIAGGTAGTMREQIDQLRGLRGIADHIEALRHA